MTYSRNCFGFFATPIAGPFEPSWRGTMKPMKLYTRSGDDGSTGLFGGQRVPKNHPRVEAYGTVDELNAALGLAAAEISRLRMSSEKPWMDSKPAGFLQRASAIIAQLQSRLFDIGADLATPAESKHESKVMRMSDEQIAESERWIDEIDAGNPPMKTFVMPGGTELAARLHLARTICRRAERAIVSLQNHEPITAGVLIYINRVSDLLFAMARRANAESGVADVPWIPRG
jgi:cob(I)alamin adenosyltransferase